MIESTLPKLLIFIEQGYSKELVGISLYRTTRGHSLSKGEGEGFAARKVKNFYKQNRLRHEPSPENLSFAHLNLIFYPLPKRGLAQAPNDFSSLPRGRVLLIFILARYLNRNPP